MRLYICIVVICCKLLSCW